MFKCWKTRPLSACVSQTCVRYIGIHKQKNTNNVKKKKNVKASITSKKNLSAKGSLSSKNKSVLVDPEKVTRKQGQPPKTRSRVTLRNVYANINHSCGSPVVQCFTPEVGHEIYSKFCMNLLKSYGFNLKLSDNSKRHQLLTGDWTVPGLKMDVVASCMLQKDELQNHSAILKKFSKDAPENSVRLFINSVGFTGQFVSNFVKSETPCILMSVSDISNNWLTQQSSYWRNRELIDKCLHHQLWENEIGFSTYKFATYRISIPRFSLQQGISLLLFNKAMISAAPTLSAGKYIYQWPQDTQSKRKKRLLKTFFYSTILVDSDKGKEDLSDLLEKEKQHELELYYQAQMKNYHENKGDDILIGDYIQEINEGVEDRGYKESTLFNHFNFSSDIDHNPFSDDGWRVH